MTRTLLLVASMCLGCVDEHEFLWYRVRGGRPDPAMAGHDVPRFYSREFGRVKLGASATAFAGHLNISLVLEQTRGEALVVAPLDLIVLDYRGVPLKRVMAGRTMCEGDAVEHGVRIVPGGCCRYFVRYKLAPELYHEPLRLVILGPEPAESDVPIEMVLESDG